MRYISWLPIQEGTLILIRQIVEEKKEMIKADALIAIIWKTCQADSDYGIAKKNALAMLDQC